MIRSASHAQSSRRDKKKEEPKKQMSNDEILARFNRKK